MGLIRDLWPTKWLPPFRRGDWSEEEVVETRIVKAGTYDASKISDTSFIYRDRMQEKNYRINFLGGTIYLERI